MTDLFKNDIIVIPAIGMGCKLMTGNFPVTKCQPGKTEGPLADNNLYRLQNRVLPFEYI